jgi:uncharacterized membrane protein
MFNAADDPQPREKRTIVRNLQSAIWWLSHFWFGLALLLPLSFLLLAVLAPAFMRDGRTAAANGIYDFMRLQNHQLPQRSYFLFGQEGGLGSYEVAELVANGADERDLEAFLGNAHIGYKTALNQRMLAIFSGAVSGALLWLAARGRLRFSALFLLLFFLPMLLDAGSHLLGELGVGGWRQANLWAVPLWGDGRPPGFYTGVKWGTLNWGLRSVTGLLFGLGLGLFLCTRFDQYFRQVRAVLVQQRERKEAGSPG